MIATTDNSVLLSNVSVWTETEESRKSPMFENMNVIKDETGQHMVEILSSGSSSAISKPIRSIHQYINSLIEKISVGLVVCDDAPSKSVAHLSGGNSASTSTTSKDLHFRDLRLLYTPLNPNETHTILVRSHCVLVSLDPFQAVIMADRIIVVLPTNYDANENMCQILRMFENNFRGTCNMLEKPRKCFSYLCYDILLATISPTDS